MRSRADRIVVALTAILVIFCAVAFEYTGEPGKKPAFSSAPLDDAWIHFVYAKSLGTTLRLDYNPGQPEAGFSSLLWVVLLAPFMLLRLPPVLIAKILGMAALLFSGWFLYEWIKDSAKSKSAVFGAVLVASSPILVYSALSGMETIIYAVAMIAATAFFFQSKHKTTALLLAAVMWARPDGAFFVVCIWAGFIATFIVGKLGKSPVKKITVADASAVFGLPIGAGIVWAGYCFLATGRWLPSSYYVRAGGSDFFFQFDRLSVLVEEVYRAAFVGNPWIQVALLVLGAGYLLFLKREKALVIILFVIAFPLIMSGQNIQIIGGTFPGNRYLAPVLPFLFGLQAFGIAAATAGVEKLLKNRGTIVDIAGWSTATVLFLLLVFPFAQWKAHFDTLRGEFALSCDNIESMQVTTGRWIASNTPEDAMVATFDAGAIRFIGNRKTLDILSLNSHESPPQNLRIVKGQADYLATYPVHSKQLVGPFAENEVFSVTLDNNIACADKTMVVYRILKLVD